MTAPVAITNARDGSNRLFVAEQGGRIISLDEKGGNFTEFLDLSELTEAAGEQGLLGLAFHPDFETNGRLFVNYTDEAGDTVISEYRTTGDGTRGDPASARVLMEVDQPYVNHNGGHLAFGPDGFLYIALGDGGSGGDPHDYGQSLETLLGKILRIDVDRTSAGEYSIPRDNPFVDEPGARPEIWHFGLRNPWRFSFDSETGEMWIGDVGQDVLEEIDRAPSIRGGLNFGWDDMEGSECYEPSSGCLTSNRILPITEYSHEFGCSITGGHVYRGTEQESLVGGYFFSDYCSGTIWTVPADAKTGTRATEILKTDSAISSFGESEDGELFVTDLNGAVFQLKEGK